MSDDGKNPPDDKPPRPLRVIKSNETVLAKPSEEQVKQLFMASAHVEWSPFAKTMKWSPASRDQYPDVEKWIHEKKTSLAREQSEQISEQLFGHRSRWHSDVLKTLKDYPEAHDSLLGILKARENEFIQMINEDIMEKQKAVQEGREPKLKFSKVKTSELLGLAVALKTVTEAKHKSLLIGDWSVKVAETFTDPNQFQKEDDKMKDTGWKMQVIGAENVTTAQMQEALVKWYDKPELIHHPSQVDPDKDKV